jgi:hypothetical protein
VETAWRFTSDIAGVDVWSGMGFGRAVVSDGGCGLDVEDIVLFYAFTRERGGACCSVDIGEGTRDEARDQAAVEQVEGREEVVRVVEVKGKKEEFGVFLG